MTRKDLLQIPGLGAVIQSLDKRPIPTGSLLAPRQHCTARFAEPGDVWRVVETGQLEDCDYSSTDPHCSTVLILKREEELAGGHAVYRAAPVLADIRYCGLQDAIFPPEVFGYEAAVTCGCEFTLTSKELEQCEGSLPEKWFDQLVDFAAWVEAEETGDQEASETSSGKTEPSFPPLLKTGRPFTHFDDPGYVFHAKLAANLQPLMVTVLEECWIEEGAAAMLAHERFPKGIELFDIVSEWIERRTKGLVGLAESAELPPSVEFRVPIAGTKFVLWLFSQADGSLCEIWVLPSDSKTDERSNEMDGATIVPTTGDPVKIENGRAISPLSDIIKGFDLIASDGKRFTLGEGL